MKIVIDIPCTQEQWENAKERGHIDIDGVEIAQGILDGLPLSELKDKWKSSCEQMCQEKICELNKRKKELENQLNISVQNNVIDEIIMCCGRGMK